MQIRNMKKTIVKNILITLFIYIAILCCSLNILNLNEYAFAVLIGAIVIVSLSICACEKRLFVICVGVFATVLALLMILRWNVFLLGLKLIANKMFAQSEHYQSYEYDKFSVSTGFTQSLDAIKIAILIISVLIAIMCVFMVKKHSVLLAIGIFAIYSLVVAYYGVSPKFVWNIVLLFALVMLLISGENNSRNNQRRAVISFGIRIKSFVLIIIMITIISGLVVLIQPQENQQVSKVDEHLRDVLAIRTEAYQKQIKQFISEKKSQLGNESQQNKIEKQKNKWNNSDEKKWRRTETLALLILGILLVLFVPAILYDRFRKKQEKNRKGIDDSEIEVAISAMFRYTMQWLILYGLKPINESNNVYVSQLKELMQGEYIEEYSKILKLWQEAVFSSHEMTRLQRDQMEKFMKSTIKEILNKSKFKDRILIKYYYAM